MKSTPSSSTAGVLRLSNHDLHLDALFNKRVLQIFGIYFAGAWPFFQFVQWLVDYYVLSPHLVEVCLFALVFMIPAVLLLAYTRGVRGFEHVTRAEMIGVPCNLLGVIVVLALLFGGKDLGSAQHTVTMTTFEGDTVERVIPKSTFRKRMGLFFFDNATGAADNDWMRSAVPDLLDADLSQDLFLTVTPATTFAERLAEVGFADGFSAPLALRRQIAQDYHLDYLLDGSIHRTDTGYRLETRLYATDSGKLLEERSFEGGELMPLVDEATIRLKHDLDIPSHHIEETTDLPASEVLTPSLDALQAYSSAIYSQHFEHDFARAGELLDQAITEDPTFAFAHVWRGINLNYQGHRAQALEAYRLADQHNYRLTERFKFLVNTGILNMQDKPDEAMQSVQQWHALYPDDTYALAILATLHTLRDETDAAVEARRKLLALDPSEQSQLLEIGDALREKARFEEALDEYRAYIERVPDQVDGYMRLGRTYQQMGDLEAEREAYTKALAIDASDPSLLGELADIEMKLGHFDEAQRQYERAIELSRTPQEQAAAQGELAGYYRFRGQLEAYVQMVETSWETIASFAPPLQVFVKRVVKAPDFARSGAVEAAQKLVAEARAHPAAADRSLSAVIDITEAAVWLETGRAAEVAAVLDEATATLDALGIRQNLGADQVRAMAYQKLGQWDAAVQAYTTDLAMMPYNSTTWRRLGEVRYQLGELRQAENDFQQALKYYPTAPATHLSLARLLIDTERPDEAREHLQQALAAWAAADEDFEPAAEARRLLASLPNA